MLCITAIIFCLILRSPYLSHVSIVLNDVYHVYIMFDMVLQCVSTVLSMITMFHHACGQVFTVVFHIFFDTFLKQHGCFTIFLLHFSNHGHGFFTISPSEAHGFSQHLLAPPLRPRPRWSAVPPCARWPSLRATAARGADRPPPRGFIAMEGTPMVLDGFGWSINGYGWFLLKENPMNIDWDAWYSWMVLDGKIHLWFWMVFVEGQSYLKLFFGWDIYWWFIQGL